MNTTSELRSKIERLVDSGQKPSYLTKFIYCEPKDSKTKGYCPEHDKHFITATRNLTQPCRHGNTCPFCMREAGEIEFRTWPEFKTLINESDFPFEIADPSQFSESDFFNSKYGGLKKTTKIALRCSKNVLHTDQPCSKVTQHTYNNIDTALSHPEHLHCQGHCDSKKKGKAKRKNVEYLQEKLKEKFQDEWVLESPNEFVKMSQSTWFQHKCGNARVAIPSKVLSVDYHLSCPYCTSHSALKVIDGSIDALKDWVSTITAGKTQLLETQFPKTNRPFSLLCNVCNTHYQASESQLRDIHRGCQTCYSAAQSQQRAWVLEEAQTLLEKRNFKLLEDPKSYVINTKILDLNTQKIQNSTLLALIKAHPLTATAKLHPHPNSTNYFSTITDQSAFYAGLIATDATLRKSGTISLELKAADENLLLSMTEFLDIGRTLSYRTMKTVDGRGIYASFQFTIQQVVENLAKNFGIKQDKTNYFCPPFSVQHSQSWALFAGMLAGDGHVRVNRRSNLAIIHFVTKSETCAFWVKALWESAAGKMSIYKSASGCYNLELEGSRALEIYKKIAHFNFGNGRKASLMQKVLTKA